MSRAFISTPRYGLVAFVILACFATLLGRLYQLHVIMRPELLEVAEKNRQVFDVLYARRGDIVDQRGNVLATTRSVIELGLDPNMTVDADLDKLPQLSQLIDVPVADLEKAFTTKTREEDSAEGPMEQMVHWTVLKPEIEEETYEKVNELGIKAVYGIRKFQRVYPGGELAAHVLGYVNKEDEPAMGVEAYMDFYLRGQDGWRKTEHDGRRNELPQFSTEEVQPTDGLSVELTLDAMLQYYAEQEVKQLVAQYGPQAVSIIISDPATGEIQALANYPTFDPNHYWDFPMANMTNHAVSDAFEPGSTFKIVTASAALNEGLVQPTDQFDCSKPTIEYRGKELKLPRDAEHNGILTVSQIVSESSNRGAANLGVLLGEDRLYGYARAFGFGESTGFGLGGESRGILNPVSSWDGLTITRMPMGQAVAATALQVHEAMTVIANHGVLMEPHLVRRVFDENNQTVVAFPPVAKRRVISSQTADEVNEMLCDVVGPDGTAMRAKLQDITVAGKTGTAQKVIDGHYSDDHFVSSFSGYFPAERPRLVMTIVVDDAHFHGTPYGGLVAAPAFHDIAQQAVQYLGIQPAGGRENLLAMKGDNLDWFR
ncbi:MAG: penicillin-binding protein 2 [Opitutales bacterium]|jgi:cell division protein FtsI (penicillin-binding protein 3)/stage V sporulation protein D (sporulation-specific penicillin-binding protein)